MPDLTPDVEVMTVAKWTAQYCDAARNAPWYLGTLAALEEREALLGERDRLREDAEHHRELAGMRLRRINQLDTDNADLRRSADERNSIFVAQKSDASVGALVRRIREHQPRAYLSWRTSPCNYDLDEQPLQLALDSLLPKEPEVVTGKSGRNYRRHAGSVQARVDYVGEPSHWVDAQAVPVVDAPVVAALMAKGGKDD